jgi:protein involved in polysaccharide export with SLBB domain
LFSTILWAEPARSERGEACLDQHYSDCKPPALEAIVAAGGFTHLAERDAVRVTRPNSKPKNSIVDVDRLMRETEPNPPQLQKGDVIFVPERILGDSTQAAMK